MMTTVTPRSTLPSPYRNAALVLHQETNVAIRDIVVAATDNDILRDTPGITTPTNDGRRTVINALKTLLDDGIVKTLQVFHARTVDNEQEHRIAKATVEPLLEQAAARIAAVVEAELPVNHPTLKGIIHVDVDKMTEDLRCRIKSLEDKLEETKSTLKRKASTSRDIATLQNQKKKAKNMEGDGTKSNKTPGNAVALSTTTPNKNKKRRRKATTKNPNATPANDNASTTANKRPRKSATGHKFGGKGKGKPTAARN
jgi:hypothetical protein